MAPFTSSKLFAFSLVLLWSGTLYANGCFSSIISFGDSIADTGNLKHLASISDDIRFPCGPPYGQNFIGQSTGRCSNGRLIIDFLDCRNFIGRSLILMGEIGGNDYNIPLSRGRPIDEVQSYVPLVIDTMISALKELIAMGARTIVVPGNFPIGCFPSYLTTGVTGVSDKEAHDPITGCLTKLNEFSEYHNKMLQTKLNQIRELNPNVVIIYADYYNAAMQIYLSPDEYGFTDGVLKACCGCGGPFNYNASTRCGDESTILCDEPDKYVSWDGVHLTEAAYKLIFMSLFQGQYTTPEFYSVCPKTSTSQGTIRLSSSI